MLEQAGSELQPDKQQVTRLLHQWSEGDKQALDQLMPLVHQQLRMLASRCMCGIPSVTLTGLAEDWQRIRDRVEVLETYDLSWWVPRLRLILDEFVLTANRQPSRRFWQAIYKPVEAYGDVSVTGWIADLFPYLGQDAASRTRNRVFEFERENWAMPVDKGVETQTFMSQFAGGKGAHKSSFPPGLSSVPVKVKQLPGIDEVDFVAGFLAVEQDTKTLALSPLIGWSVAKSAPVERVLI